MNDFILNDETAREAQVTMFVLIALSEVKVNEPVIIETLIQNSLQYGERSNVTKDEVVRIVDKLFIHSTKTGLTCFLCKGEIYVLQGYVDNEGNSVHMTCIINSLKKQIADYRNAFNFYYKEKE